MWNSGFLSGLADAARDFIHDYIVMGRVTTQQAAEADDGVIFPGFSESAGGGGNFKGTGNADDSDVLLFGARAKKTVISTTKKPFSNELIEPGSNDSETKTGGIQLSGKRFLSNLFLGGPLRGSVPPW